MSASCRRLVRFLRARVDQARRIPGVEAIEVLAVPGRRLCPLAGSFDRTLLARALTADAPSALAAVGIHVETAPSGHVDSTGVTR